MANLSEIYIKREIIDVMNDVLQKRKDDKGISITISTNDESNEWGQNVSAYVSQTKEEREEKKKKFYVGNGKVFWTDGKITVGVKPSDDVVQDAQVVDDGGSEDLPF